MMLMDRYILRMYVRVLAICVVSFCGMFIVADAFNNLEEFITHGEKTEGGVIAVLSAYYPPRTLTTLNITGGLLALMASVFTVTSLRRSRELTAILAGGVPAIRIAAPLISASVCVAALGVVNREYWIPAYRDTLSRDAQNLDGMEPRPVESRYDHATSIYLDGSRAYLEGRQIVSPSFRLPRSLRAVGRKIIGKTAFFHPQTEDRPAGFLIDGLTHPLELLTRPSIQINGRQAILTPTDTPWLESGQCFIVSDVDFQQLANSESWLEYSSVMELMRAMHNPSMDYGADVRVAIHTRFLQPILDVLLVLIGLPLVMTRRDQNVFVAVGKCILLVIGFSLVVLGAHQAGAAYLVRPALAAWIPVILLTPVAVFLLHSLWE